MSVKVTFLGAAGTVTGSSYLISHGAVQILVDCGIFQGERSWREKNWHPPHFNPSEITAVLLTHGVTSGPHATLVYSNHLGMNDALPLNIGSLGFQWHDLALCCRWI